MKMEKNKMNPFNEFTNLRADSSLDLNEHPATFPPLDLNSSPTTDNLVDLTDDAVSVEQNEVACDSFVLIDNMTLQSNFNSEDDGRQKKLKISAGIVRTTASTSQIHDRQGVVLTTNIESSLPSKQISESTKGLSGRMTDGSNCSYKFQIEMGFRPILSQPHSLSWPSVNEYLLMGHRGSTPACLHPASTMGIHSKLHDFLTENDAEKEIFLNSIQKSLFDDNFIHSVGDMTADLQSTNKRRIFKQSVANTRTIDSYHNSMTLSGKDVVGDGTKINNSLDLQPGIRYPNIVDNRAKSQSRITQNTDFRNNTFQLTTSRVPQVGRNILFTDTDDALQDGEHVEREYGLKASLSRFNYLVNQSTTGRTSDLTFGGSGSVLKSNSAGSFLSAEGGGSLQANPAGSIYGLQSGLPGCNQAQAMPDGTNHVILKSENVSPQINLGNTPVVQAKPAVSRHAIQAGSYTGSFRVYPETSTSRISPANQRGPVRINPLHRGGKGIPFQTHQEQGLALLPSTGVTSMVPVNHWYPYATSTGPNHIASAIPSPSTSIVHGGPYRINPVGQDGIGIPFQTHQEQGSALLPSTGVASTVPVNYWYPYATSTGPNHIASAIPSLSTSIVQGGPSKINPVGQNGIGIPFQTHQEQGSALLPSSGVASTVPVNYWYPYATSTGPNHIASAIPSHNSSIIQGGPSRINQVGVDTRSISSQDLKIMGTKVGEAINQSAYFSHQSEQSLERRVQNAQLATGHRMLPHKKRKMATSFPEEQHGILNKSKLNQLWPRSDVDLHELEKGKVIVTPTMESHQNKSMPAQNTSMPSYQKRQRPPIASYIKREVPDLKLLGERCQLCGIDLAFTPTGSYSYSSEPPVHAVLPCGHCFHYSCLEGIFGSPEPSQIPTCVRCLE